LDALEKSANHAATRGSKEEFCLAIQAPDALRPGGNDLAPPPFGVFAPNGAQRAIISLAHRTRLKRGAFRPMLSRLVNLFRAGPVDTHYQGAAFRFYHQASATERGALFNPDYNLAELDFLRANTPVGGVFVDVGANVGTYAMVLARHVGPTGRVIAIEPHPLIHARLAFNSAASRYRHVKLIAAAAGDRDGELMIETDGGNLGASHIATGATSAGSAIRVPALRLLRVLGEAGVSQLDSLKIDVEGYEDRVLVGFFRDAPQALWPRAVVIEHLSRNEWLSDCLGDMLARGYVATAKTRSNTLLLRQ
jgi:FkbM family methyltransferase